MMMQLIVLGVVPGTDVTITFNMLLNIFGVMLLIVFARAYYVTHRKAAATSPGLPADIPLPPQTVKKPRLTIPRPSMPTLRPTLTPPTLRMPKLPLGRAKRLGMMAMAGARSTYSVASRTYSVASSRAASLQKPTISRPSLSLPTTPKLSLKRPHIELGLLKSLWNTVVKLVRTVYELAKVGIAILYAHIMRIDLKAVYENQIKKAGTLMANTAHSAYKRISSTRQNLAIILKNQMLRVSLWLHTTTKKVAAQTTRIAKIVWTYAKRYSVTFYGHASRELIWFVKKTALVLWALFLLTATFIESTFTSENIRRLYTHVKVMSKKCLTTIETLLTSPLKFLLKRM